MTDTLSHLLCRGLIKAGIDALYCLPGVQNDDFLNGLGDFPEIRPFVGRHEQACSCMATGAALASGKPQAYCTVPGQGVLNAAAGHSTAFDAAGPAVVEMPVDKIYPSPWTHIFLPTVRGEPQVPMLEMPD